MTSVANEIAHLATRYGESGEWFFAEEIRTILKTIDEDLNCRPSPENAGLRLFVEAEDELGMDDAESVVEDFRGMWPSVKNISADNIVIIKRHLLAADVDLECRLLKPFMAEACWRLENKDSDFHGDKMVKDVAESAVRFPN